MARSVNYYLNIKHLRFLGGMVIAFLTVCLVAQLTGCLPRRAPQKLHKIVTIKSAPRQAALNKQSPLTHIDWQIYLPFMPQMQSVDPLTHPNSPVPAAPVTSPPSLKLFGIDFEDQQDWIRIKLYPKNRRVNNGEPIILKFVPGDHCTYSDHRACVAAFQSSEGTPIIWLTIHSGVGGEGQSFRDAVEGTGIDRAAYSLQKITANLQALSGSQVVISQGMTSTRNLYLQATARIPGSMLQGYFSTSLEDTLDFATQIAPELQPANQSTLPLIVFETCGWRVPGQPWFPGTTDTSASVYISVIRLSP
jgi:hypothetical protein